MAVMPQLERHAIVDYINCPRCNAEAKVLIERKVIIGACLVVEVCDKCKLRRTVKFTSDKAWPYYYRLGILRGMRRLNEKDKEAWDLPDKPVDVTLDRTIKFIEDKIEIFELGLNA